MLASIFLPLPALFAFVHAAPPGSSPAIPLDSRDAAAEEAACCASESARFKGWQLTDVMFQSEYKFSTPSHLIPSAHFSFNVHNPALRYTVWCDGWSSTRFDEWFLGDVIFECSVPQGRTGSASFSYTRANGFLELIQTWSCYEDAKHPATFHAGGHATVNLNDCAETFWENPNWAMGQDYSVRTVRCGPIAVPVNADWIWGVA